MNKEYFKYEGHYGPIISENYDWNGGHTIFYCLKCRKLHIFEVDEVSSNTEFLMGMRNWHISLKDYTEKYCAYQEIVEKARKMGIKIE